MIPKNELRKYVFPRMHVHKKEGGYAASTIVRLKNREPKEVVIERIGSSINNVVEEAASDAQYWMHQDLLASPDLLVSVQDLNEVFGTMIGPAKMEGFIKYLTVKSNKKKRLGK